jgi:hypothetical protein
VSLGMAALGVREFLTQGGPANEFRAEDDETWGGLPVFVDRSCVRVGCKLGSGANRHNLAAWRGF